MSRSQLAQAIAVIALVVSAAYLARIRSNAPVAAVPSEHGTGSTRLAAEPTKSDGLAEKKSATLVEGANAAGAIVLSQVESSNGKPTTGMMAVAVTSEMRAFSDLKRKVLMNDKERGQKEAMLRDPKFLGYMADLLKTPSDVGSELRHAQGDAVEGLVEALKVPGAEANATAAMTGVVKDAEVENQALPMAARESLASFKGELLYRWTAAAPAVAGGMPALLPGPVSQKIWKNVLAEQNQNRLQSAEQQASR